MDVHVEDYEFVPCELCETMVRFDDYTQHVEECENRLRNPYFRFVPIQPLVFPNLRYQQNGTEAAEAREDGQEPVEDNGDGDGDEGGGETQDAEAQPPLPNIPVLDFSSLFQPLLAPLNSANLAMAPDMPNLQDDTILSDPFALLESNLNLVNDLLQRNRNFGLGALHNENAQENQDTEDTEGETDERRVLDNPNDIIQNMRRRVQNALDEHTPSNVDGSAGRLFFQMTRLLQPQMLPQPEMSDYDFNLMLASLIGKVERGVENIDNVSKIVTKYPEDSICPVCQEGFADIPDKPKRELLCGHMFCDECISKWLEKNIKCPVCMVDLESFQANTKIKSD